MAHVSRIQVLGLLPDFSGKILLRPTYNVQMFEVDIEE